MRHVLHLHMFIRKTPYPKNKIAEREIGGAALYEVLANPTYKNVARRAKDSKEIVWFNGIVDFVRRSPGSFALWSTDRTFRYWAGSLIFASSRSTSRASSVSPCMVSRTS